MTPARAMRQNGIDWLWCNLCGWYPADEPWSCFITGLMHESPSKEVG